MTYTNGFTINAAGNECFITFLQTRPNGQSKNTEEVETVVMTEQLARQLIHALSQVYAKVDSDRNVQMSIPKPEVFQIISSVTHETSCSGGEERFK